MATGVIARRGQLGPVPYADLVSSAEAFWRAEDYNPTQGQYLKDASGHGHHARLGSSGRAEVIDGALVLPWAVGHYAASSDHVDLDITGDIDIIVKVALDDWTPSTTMTLLSKWIATGNQRAYRFGVFTSGALFIGLSVDGTAEGTVLSDAPSDIANAGAAKWCRVTWRQSDGRVQFFTSDDGTAWMQRGANKTFAIASIASTTATLSVGQEGTSVNPVSGRIYRAIVKNGIDGTIVFDADFISLSDGAPWFLDATGKRVTVQPTRSVVTDGTLWLPGSSTQYALSPDHADLDGMADIDLRVKVALDDWTPSANSTLIAKSSTLNRSYELAVNTSGELTFSGATGGSAINFGARTDPLGYSDGSERWLRATRIGSTGAIQFFESTDGVTWSTLITTVTVGSPTGNIFAGSTSLSIGTRLIATGSEVAGRIYRAIVKSGIDGTTVFDVDFSTWDDGDGMGGYPKKESTGKYVAVLSDTTGVDANEPKWLKYSADADVAESKGLYLPGVSGNYASVPDEAALDITGDITIDCEVAFDDWTPATACEIVSKRGGTGYEYVLRVNSTGTLELFWANGATTVAPGPSTTSIAALDGQRLWVRGTRTIDGADYRVKYFTSLDEVTWTPLGADVTVVAASNAPVASTNDVGIGARTGGTTGLAVGRVFRARIYNGYFDGITQGGSLVLDVDFVDSVEPHSSFVCSTGQTVTINRSASGRKSVIVDRPMFLFGTGNYMECADHDALDFNATESLSTALAFRSYGASAPGMWKRSSSSAGYESALRGDQTWQFRISDGTNTATRPGSGPAVPNGEAAVGCGVRDVINDALLAYTDGVETNSAVDSTTGSIASTTTLRLYNNFSSSVDGEFIGAGVWRRAFQPGEVNLLESTFGV